MQVCQHIATHTLQHIHCNTHSARRPSSCMEVSHALKHTQCNVYNSNTHFARCPGSCVEACQHTAIYALLHTLLKHTFCPLPWLLCEGMSTHCNTHSATCTLQHTVNCTARYATHCNKRTATCTLQHTFDTICIYEYLYIYTIQRERERERERKTERERERARERKRSRERERARARARERLDLNAAYAHCSALQHTAARGSALQHTHMNESGDTYE